MKNQNRPSLIRHFCFHEQSSTTDSVFFAGTCNLANNTIQRYSIKEGSNVINYDLSQSRTINQEVRSIYAVPNSNAFFLLTRDNQNKYNIAHWSASLNSEMTQNLLILSSDDPIIFFQPIFNQHIEIAPFIQYNYFFYATAHDFHVYYPNDKDRQFSIGNQTNIYAGASISNDLVALGCGTELKIYDIRQNQAETCELQLHSGRITDISVSPIDNNHIYTGGFDGIVKHLDRRNFGHSIDEVFTGCSNCSEEQSPVMHVAPHPKDLSIFATVAAGNISSSYVKIFKNGDQKYRFYPHRSEKEAQSRDMWIEWSNQNPSLLVSVNSFAQFKTHYFFDIDFC